MKSKYRLMWERPGAITLYKHKDILWQKTKEDKLTYYPMCVIFFIVVYILMFIGVIMVLAVFVLGLIVMPFVHIAKYFWKKFVDK